MSKQIARQKRKIQKLKKENERLRRENEELHQALGNHPIVSDLFRKKKSATEELAAKQARSVQHFSRNYFTTYLISHFKSTSFFSLFRRVVNAVRRYTFITTSIRILILLLTVLQSGAIIVLSASFFVIYVPIMLAATYLTIFITLFGRKAKLRKDSKWLDGKQITIFFPPKQVAMHEDSYFATFVDAMASRQKSCTIIVSPYLFSKKGLSQTPKHYLLSRLESENVLLVRRHYYFRLKKGYLTKATNRITEIY